MATKKTEAEITAAMKELTARLWKHQVATAEKYGLHTKEAKIAFELYVYSSNVDLARGVFLRAAKEYQRAKDALKDTNERFAVVFGVEENNE